MLVNNDPKNGKIPCHEIAGELIKALHQRSWTIATAESCTGGMIAESLTAISGASEVFGFGWVSYANEAKTAMLGVDEQLFEQEGAVSQQVVQAMAEGALHHSQANIAIAVSGIAGPSGGSLEKPIGTVWVAWSFKGGITQSEKLLHPASREEFRQFITQYALSKALLFVRSQIL